MNLASPLLETQKLPVRGWRRAGQAVPALAIALALVLAGGGCSRVPFIGKLVRSDQALENPVEFLLRLDRADVRPGDALVAYVSIRNLTSKALTGQLPDASSIEFYSTGSGEAVQQIWPVFSSQEPMGEVRDLAPGEIWRRTFVFTTPTKEPGNYRLQAIYHLAPKGIESSVAPVVSKPAAFQVTDVRSFRRDRDGILLKEDAIAIAKAHLGRPVAEATALLVTNKAGLFDWWVTLAIDPGDLKAGEQAHRAFFVSPYLATVVQTRSAKPYPLEEQAPPLPVQITPPAPPE